VSSLRLLVLIIFLLNALHHHQSAVDTRILTEPLTFQFIFNPEETPMNSDEDTFFEDDEYEEEEEEEDSFPDEEFDEEEDDDFDPADVLYEPSEGRLASFVKDPWPQTVFILVIIGLAILLLTPTNLWFIWNYFLIANYFMIIIGAAAITYSLITWDRAGKHRLRWAAVTNLIVVLLLIILASLDTFSWIINAASIIPGVQTPIISLALILAVFSIYSLWVIQRNFAQPKR
jgi:hypothetical protein